MKKKLNDLSLTEKMIVCHDLTQMDQALILINWCPVQYKHLSNNLKRLALKIFYQSLVRMSVNLTMLHSLWKEINIINRQ